MFGRSRGTASSQPRQPVRRRMALWRRRGVMAFAAAATAAVTVSATGAYAATVTQISGGETNPLGILQLTGGDGLKHLWVSDHLNGLCRLDPGPNGQLVENINSCVLFFGRAALKPGQLAYQEITDGQGALHRYIYLPDLGAKSLGVLRLGYDPALNGGLGGIALFDRTQLVANCGIGGSVPWAAALSPNGNLYIAYKKSSNITRIRSVAALGTISANCGADVQNFAGAADGKKAFQLAFNGADLWSIDGLGFGAIPNADTAPNGTRAISLLIGAVPAATSLTSNGAGILYAGNATAVYAVNLNNGGSSALISGGFAFTTSIAVDTTGPAGSLFVADDTSNGTFNGQGRIWAVAP